MSNSVKFRVWTRRFICFMYPVSTGDVGAQLKRQVLGHHTILISFRIQIEESYFKKGYSWAKCIKLQHLFNSAGESLRWSQYVSCTWPWLTLNVPCGPSLSIRKMTHRMQDKEEHVSPNNKHLHFLSFLEKCGITSVELHCSFLRVCLLALSSHSFSTPNF